MLPANNVMLWFLLLILGSGAIAGLLNWRDRRKERGYKDQGQKDSEPLRRRTPVGLVVARIMLGLAVGLLALAAWLDPTPLWLLLPGVLLLPAGMLTHSAFNPNNPGGNS